MENYTIKNFEKQFAECYTELSSLGYTRELTSKKYQLHFIDTLKTLGRCKNCGSNRYTIYLNKAFADIEKEQNIKNTIMHELIHSLDGCMRHTGRWREIADIVNARLGYNINRTSSHEDYDKYYTAKKSNSAKYEIKCTKCGCSTKYQRNTKTVQRIIAHEGRYSCGVCHMINSFIVTELT